MSARNGDKFRFDRERNQKVARRRRTHELRERTATVRKSAETTVNEQHSLFLVSTGHDHSTASSVTAIRGHAQWRQEKASAAR